MDETINRWLFRKQRKTLLESLLVSLYQGLIETKKRLLLLKIIREYIITNFDISRRRKRVKISRKKNRILNPLPFRSIFRTKIQCALSTTIKRIVDRFGGGEEHGRVIIILFSKNRIAPFIFRINERSARSLYFAFRSSRRPNGPNFAISRRGGLLEGRKRRNKDWWKKLAGGGVGRRCRNGEGDEKTREARSSVANRVQKHDRVEGAKRDNHI